MKFLCAVAMFLMAYAFRNIALQEIEQSRYGKEKRAQLLEIYSCRFPTYLTVQHKYGIISNDHLMCMNMPAKVRAFNPRVIQNRERASERQEGGNNYIDQEGCIKILHSCHKRKKHKLHHSLYKNPQICYILQFSCTTKQLDDFGTFIAICWLFVQGLPHSHTVNRSQSRDNRNCSTTRSRDRKRE